MLAVEINGESLDLLPGTRMDLEKQNPFLQFTTDLLGDYSLPFQVLATEKNMRLLNYAAVPQQRVTSAGIDAILYDNGIQIMTGKIKIEKPNIHLNKYSRGTINCYFLSGAGDFWQEIKDKKLREINAGGDRSFDWDGLTTSTSGFWSHIHKVVAGVGGPYDYAFYPVINLGWPQESVYPPVMNMLYYDSGQAYPVHFPTTYVPLDVRERNRIVPFPYLKYVLLKAIEYVGWSIEGDILSDADFQKITMLNFRAIDWCFVKVDGGLAYVESYRDPVVFNLQDHLPDITIGNFLIALKNRFGWRYEFDNTAKKITIYGLTSLTVSSPVDMTAKSSPLITKNITQQEVVYALKNNFAVSSVADGKPDFNVVALQGEVVSNDDLPAAIESYYGHIYLVKEENNYYICLQNLEDGVWQWWHYAYNIYDYAPSAATNEIVTDATVVGNERYSAYLDSIPRIDNPGEWFGRDDAASSWGIHLLFYFGLRNNKSGTPLPFASHHIYDSNGVKLAQWSLAFKGLDAENNEVGLYDLNWKPFLDMISGFEEVEHTLYLTLDEYLQLKFSTRIVINGIELFVKQIKPSIPFNGIVNCVSVRV